MAVESAWVRGFATHNSTASKNVQVYGFAVPQEECAHLYLQKRKCHLFCETPRMERSIDGNDYDGEITYYSVSSFAFDYCE